MKRNGPIIKRNPLLVRVSEGVPEKSCYLIRRFPHEVEAFSRKTRKLFFAGSTLSSLLARGLGANWRSGIWRALAAAAILSIALFRHESSIRSQPVIRTGIPAAITPAVVLTERTAAAADGRDAQKTVSFTSRSPTGVNQLREFNAPPKQKLPQHRDAKQSLSEGHDKFSVLRVHEIEENAEAVDPIKSVNNDTFSAHSPELENESLPNLVAEHPESGQALLTSQLSLGLTNEDNAREAHSRDVNAVLATLKKYSDAWHAKDVGDIVAVRPGLGKRIVEQELSSVQTITMRIRPISSPKIEGNRAAVDCIHEVEETFRGGIEKANPGRRMTYDLVRRGENWLIEDSR